MNYFGSSKSIDLQTTTILLSPGLDIFLLFFLEKLTTGIKKKEWPLDCFHPKCHASFYDIIDAQLTQDIYFTLDF